MGVREPRGPRDGGHRVEPHALGSRATLSIAFAGPVARLVGWLSRSLTRWYLHLEAAGLKARSEERSRARARGGRGRRPAREARLSSTGMRAG